MRPQVAIRYAVRVRPAVLFLLIALTACKNEKPASSPSESGGGDKQCREDTGDDVNHGLKTGVSGAKTGVTTAGEGVKAFGSSAAGLVEGGSDEAKKRWREGKKETKATAKEGAQETKKEAQTPKCSGR